jgi:hypothetical protein
MPGCGVDCFFSWPRRHRAWGRPSFLSCGYCAAFTSRIKRTERESDYSLPYSAEIKTVELDFVIVTNVLQIGDWRNVHNEELCTAGNK